MALRIRIPIHPLRQISDHREISVVEPDGAGVFAKCLALLCGAGGVADSKSGIEAGLGGLVTFQAPVDLALQDRQQLGPTDEAHIIRTIEYWDIERKRPALLL